MTNKYWNNLKQRINNIKYLDVYSLLKEVGLGFTNYIDVDKGDIIHKVIVHERHEDERFKDDWLEMYVEHTNRFFHGNQVNNIVKRYVVNRSEIKNVKFFYE